ncbi:hypothetical protein [Sphingomonas hylomeconis]|uniref:Secreted protein n=1 Tax=Sphingomonas hylomeconis TaxID=1395958 RepID=A0ABV7SQI4_9SPHN|nr:hypothetical protein [Sphingomonas hylomeconis]
MAKTLFTAAVIRLSETLLFFVTIGAITTRPVAALRPSTTGFFTVTVFERVAMPGI